MTAPVLIVDRSGWASGPWDNEPDREDWIHESGLPCMVLRHSRNGTWCGYVGVAPGHPWHEQDFMDIDAEVHGGPTYSAACWGDPPHGICHVPAEGGHDARWWIGFDCNHAWDLAPGYFARNPEFSPFDGEVYRTLSYVRSETNRLAAQAAERERELAKELP